MISSGKKSHQMFRLIDVNLDRIGEGLRLLEDIARFLLEDNEITSQLKSIRHELVSVDPSLRRCLLNARDADADIGRGKEATTTRDAESLIAANSKRVEQSLRVVEELAKMPELKLDAETFKKARFDLYSIERRLTSRLLRQEKAKLISGLYFILDTQALAGRSYLEMAKAAIYGGARVVQLRDKNITPKGKLLKIAHQLKAICAQEGALFIINDNLDIALAVGADGLHLGQEDLPFETARQMLPIDMLLGCSVDTAEEAQAATKAGADYLAVGAIFSTSSKDDIKVVGLERLRQVRKASALPLVAIGGINKSNATEVITAGANAAAVINAVSSAASPEQAAAEITKRLAEKL